MKKSFKISALALAMSALLFSCADPNNSNANGGNNGGNKPDTPAADVVKPSDVKKPEGYTPSEDATAVKNATEGNSIINAVMNEVVALDGEALGLVYDTEAFINANKTLADEAEKQAAKNDEIIAAAKQANKAYSVTYTDKTAPGTYTIPEDYSKPNTNIGTCKIVDYYMSETQSDDPTNKVSSMEEKSSQIYTTNVIDATKMKYDADQNHDTPDTAPQYVKSFKSSTCSVTEYKSTKEGDDYSNENAEGKGSDSMNGETNFVAMFEKDGKNGLLKVSESVSRTSDSTTPNITGSITFYDMEGNESYSYSKEECDAVIKEMMGPQA